MSEIMLRASDAREHAKEMTSASADASERFQITRTKLNTLAESFTGQAATAFTEQFQKWDTGAQQVVEALDGLGQFLEAAANAIEDTDTSLANQIQGA